MTLDAARAKCPRSTVAWGKVCPSPTSLRSVYYNMTINLPQQYCWGGSSPFGRLATVVVMGEVMEFEFEFCEW